VGKADHADGRWQNKEKPARGICTPDTPGEPREGERGEKCGYGARQACRYFANSENFEAESGGPIIEDGFFKPGFAVKARRDPIAGFGHIASDPCVAGFVGADEAKGPEIVEIADVKCSENQNDPGDTRYWRNSGANDGRVVGLRHGRMSLALSVYLGMVEVRSHMTAKAGPSRRLPTAGRLGMTPLGLGDVGPTPAPKMNRDRTSGSRAPALER
jgi:hypothetical protein